MLNYNLRYEIETDKIEVFEVKCRYLTQESSERMNAETDAAEKQRVAAEEEEREYTGESESDIVSRYVFSSFKHDGLEITWRQLPVEIFQKACQDHPSFRASREIPE